MGLNCNNWIIMQGMEKLQNGVISWGEERERERIWSLKKRREFCWKLGSFKQTFKLL